MNRPANENALREQGAETKDSNTTKNTTAHAITQVEDTVEDTNSRPVIPHDQHCNTATVEKPAAKDQAQAKSELFEACKHLAVLKDILKTFDTVYGACGAVGESRIAKIIYLALTTRFLQRPVSIAVKGPSSGGKSFTTDTVIKFFPAEAVYCLTAMSDRVLAYTDADLKHKFIVLSEAAGMSGDFATYLIRTLLSEGRIVYEVVEKTSEGMRPRRLEKEGPTGLLVTTTAVKLHPENETRLLSLNVTDTSQQTKAIMRKIAGMVSQPVDLAEWQALQQWLAMSKHEVVIPYAMKLAELTPAIAVRLRRDFSAVLNLIKGHAIMHQESRQKDGDGCIVATLDDYAVVRELVADIVAEGVEATVPTTMRETVDAVVELSPNHSDGVPLSALATKLKLDKGSASRRANSACQRGYLRNDEDKKGRPARFRKADSLPSETQVLPTVEALQRCSVGRGDKSPSTSVEAADVAGDVPATPSMPSVTSAQPIWTGRL